LALNTFKSILTANIKNEKYGFLMPLITNVNEF